MNNVFKVLISILAIILLLGVVVIVGGLAYFLPVERSSEVEQTVVWEESSQDTFVSELHSYEDSFELIYSPANPGAIIDCYVSYHLQENGNTLENLDRKLYENVSIKDPILLEFPRKKESVYKLDITIQDKTGDVLHRSGMEVHSSSENTK
ncbi:hypothetical protein FXV91_05960 [Methanosarcina sp. DH2]|uniref:hypothetical protein n=1 Tax=Methanosarcina sp. DH2 TaxID=2605639 RepID=UPI001E38A1BD|nr:hypothetical protein [Methanosarcina sp. DH2]MCC4769758.1 hypothetical protein [Methanosarcina sp. DH2]